MQQLQKRTWAEIHMDRLEKNYRSLREAAPGKKFMGIVKANGYGHGAEKIACRLEELGADCLAVACLDEAVRLREAGIRCPILILGYTTEEDVPQVLAYDLLQTVYDPGQAQAFSRRAIEAGGILRCHLKVDTGMSRLGVLCHEGNSEQAAAELEKMYRLPGLQAEGIFMHFADADSDPVYSRRQTERFSGVLTLLEERGIRFPLRHCCASAAVCNCPEAHYDLIRPGVALYGMYPDPSVRDKITLSPVMELKTRIASVKPVPKGTGVSYGCTVKLERDSIVAAVPVGYADGLFRGLSNRMEMLVRGTRVRQIGRICMDMCLLDVTNVPGVSEGDEVTVFGDGVPLQDLADAAGTITYELLCAVSPRVPRVYLP